MSQVLNSVQCKNVLSTVQPKCIQTKMTASFRTLILKGETQHSSGNMSSNRCSSLRCSPWMLLSPPFYTVSSAVPASDQEHQKSSVSLVKIHHFVSSQIASCSTIATFLYHPFLLWSAPCSSHHSYTTELQRQH